METHTAAPELSLNHVKDIKRQLDRAVAAMVLSGVLIAVGIAIQQCLTSGEAAPKPVIIHNPV